MQGKLRKFDRNVYSVRKIANESSRMRRWGAYKIQILKSFVRDWGRIWLRNGFKIVLQPETREKFWCSEDIVSFLIAFKPDCESLVDPASESLVKPTFISLAKTRLCEWLKVNCYEYCLLYLHIDLS